VFIREEVRSMPRSPESRARIAFIVFVLMLAAGGAGAWLLARGQNARYEIRTADNVSGLIIGAPVEFHGVEVGKVDEVDLVDAHDVRVVVAVRKSVPVTTATVATITGRGLATRGFTGYVYVSLEEQPGHAQPLLAQAGRAYPAIASAPSQAVSLDTSIRQLDDSVQTAVALMRTTLDAQTIASLKRSVANLDEVTRTLAANNARLQAILLNAERTTALMPPLLQAGAQSLRTLQAELLPQAADTLAQMNGAVAASQDTAQTIRTQLLPRAQQAVLRMDALSGSLADTADRINRNPSVLVWGERIRPGPGEAP
jgi:phospholipid/cholesterol/gamma-HCH transport system substrate-binding protein